MVFFITNEPVKQITKVIHTFEKNLIVNEQLVQLEKKINVDASHFPFNYRLPYGLHKINQLLYSGNGSRYFVLNLDKFIVEKSFNIEFYAMLDQLKVFDTKPKIVFSFTDCLLQTFIAKQNNENSINIPIIELIRHFKRNIELISAAKKLITDSKVKTLFVPSLAYDFSIVKYSQLRSFLELDYSLKTNYTSPQLQHKKIKNWEQLFNNLNKTEYYRYLK